MRSDIVPGTNFPDYQLSDHTAKHRKLSEAAHCRDAGRSVPARRHERSRRRASARCAPATAPTPRSTTGTATGDCCRRSRPGCPGASTLPGRAFAWANRSGQRPSACGGRPRRARETYRAARRELVRLVRRIHCGGAGRYGVGRRERLGLALLANDRLLVQYLGQARARLWAKRHNDQPILVPT
jgi:hypothetical protein